LATGQLASWVGAALFFLLPPAALSRWLRHDFRTKIRRLRAIISHHRLSSWFWSLGIICGISNAMTWQISKKLRRLRMGAQTLLGVKKQGFFIPYRHAEGVARPTGYPALEPVFTAARPSMRTILHKAQHYRDALLAFAGAAAPKPRWEQSWFPRLDGVAAYVLTRTEPPQKVIEVGSGHSTRFVAQALADAGVAATQLCIDPEPRASLKALDVYWRPALLSEAHREDFAALKAGDIAFFDSSHILTPGTDVDLIFNTLLPCLTSGVRVHIHDIFLPDGYPAAWEWRGYNEQNALGPLLTSSNWKVLWSSRYVATRMDPTQEASVIAALPFAEDAFETSLWLQKMDTPENPRF
jgi:hypothetical protein